MGSGFDIVIGNPPYIHFEKMRVVSEKLFKPLKFETYEARGDIYTLFYEKGIELLKDKGILTYITSNKWMRAGYGESLRDYFVTKTQPIELIDLGGGVFESATVDTNILVLRKSDYTEDTVAVAANKDLTPTNMQDFINDHSINLKFKKGESWAILTPIEQSIKEKIEKVGTPLKDWNISINYGIKTGCNEAFIISGEKRDEILANCKTAEERTRTADLIRPILRGRDIKRNSYKWAGLYLICTFPAANINIDDYPAIKKYLQSAEWSDEVPNGHGYEKLEQTGTEHNISGKKFKSRKKTGNKWFETQDQIAYMDDFSKQKIVFQEIQQESSFCLDNEKFMVSNTGYIINGENLNVLVQYLNSPIINFAYRNFYATQLGESGTRWLFQHLVNLPVPKTFNSDYMSTFDFTDEEMKFISSSVKP